MKVGILAVVLLAGVCSAPAQLTATVDVAGTSSAVVGHAEQLIVRVTNTGPLVPHLGLVFRTADRWYERHNMTDLAGCVVAAASDGFDCGDLEAGASKTYSFGGTAVAAGSFHYELALRELIQPFDYVNDHSDGPDVQVWDETIAAP